MSNDLWMASDDQATTTSARSSQRMAFGFAAAATFLIGVTTLTPTVRPLIEQQTTASSPTAKAVDVSFPSSEWLTTFDKLAPELEPDLITELRVPFQPTGVRRIPGRVASITEYELRPGLAADTIQPYT